MKYRKQIYTSHLSVGVIWEMFDYIILGIIGIKILNIDITILIEKIELVFNF